MSSTTSGGARSEYMREWKRRNASHVKAYQEACFKADPEGVRHDAKMRQRTWRARQKEKLQDATGKKMQQGKDFP